MSDPTRHPCGCVNAVHPSSGVLRSVAKCPKHRTRQRDPATLGESYYADLGVIEDGRLRPTNHVAELAEALGPIPDPIGIGDALEIGCGVSPYVEAIREAGYRYVGVEPSPWAARWMRENYGVVILNASLESVQPIFDFSFILAAHSLEHMADAPGALGKCAAFLVPCGQLWIVVPDDSDPVNPDHLWFFDESSLRSCVEAAGLVVELMTMRKYIKRENFIYCRARKP